ncbi:streptomycin 3-adenylyltransferase [Paenibacillus aquistagni]|uniref:Spectinomycin 9-adenylyltransferase n=2 Tax=Paenibacillus aquistagni TaxID=1852522 RepID=A0A1X7K1J6_9BACL|nr:streptomycin 3-adenylyltransferase [Paenibacillus aquistagni]
MMIPNEITQVVHMLQSVMKDMLTGIYLHGSLAMGCYHPEGSDIDLLIVVKQPLTSTMARTIVERVLEVEQGMEGHRGFEFSVVHEQALRPFQHPLPYELHYSAYHRGRYENEPGYRCGPGVDQDLAAHVMVALERGMCLYGEPLLHFSDSVPREAYVDALIYDIEHAATEIVTEPVYIVLNLCRVLQYLQDGAVSSKREGGQWGIVHVQDIYHGLIKDCLHAYDHGEDQLSLDKEQATSFARYMLTEIHRLIEEQRVDEGEV